MGLLQGAVATTWRRYCKHSPACSNGESVVVAGRTRCTITSEKRTGMTSLHSRLLSCSENRERGHFGDLYVFGREPLKPFERVRRRWAKTEGVIASRSHLGAFHFAG